MRTNTDGRETTMLSPDDAFATLGNDTRIEIVRGLAEADSPLSFTELRDRVGLDRGRQFNYHLDKLVGHFVTKTDDGYALAPPGERVVEAIVSGVVTRDPIRDPTVTDQQCYHCGAPVVLSYGGHLAIFCTQCTGNFSAPASDIGDDVDIDGDPDVIGFLRGFEVPPAGITDRSGLELLQAGNAWANLETISGAVDVCPRCSTSVDASLRICETHDGDEGACPECNCRYAVTYVHDCTNCNYRQQSQFGWRLLAKTDVLNFLTDHGINPIAPESSMAMRAVLDRYEEDVVTTDPFRGRFTFTIDGDALTLTVDDDLTVVEATRRMSETPDR